jgi:drug/metabolite transporter (DMT)-like permease
MKARTIASLAIIVFMWGVTFPLVKISLVEVSPITLAFLRFLLATPIMVLYSHFKDKGFKSVLTRDLAPLGVMGLTGIVGYKALQNKGVELTSATESSILTSSTPIMIALLGAVPEGEDDPETGPRDNLGLRGGHSDRAAAEP